MSGIFSKVFRCLSDFFPEIFLRFFRCFFFSGVSSFFQIFSGVSPAFFQVFIVGGSFGCLFRFFRCFSRCVFLGVSGVFSEFLGYFSDVSNVFSGSGVSGVFFSYLYVFFQMFHVFFQVFMSFSGIFPGSFSSVFMGVVSDSFHVFFLRCVR